MGVVETRTMATHTVWWEKKQHEIGQRGRKVKERQTILRRFKTEMIKKAKATMGRNETIKKIIAR